MGIGLELSRVFASNGHPLVLVARNRETLEPVARELEAKHGVRTLVVPADLAREGEVERLAGVVHAEGIAVEYLVNNAGFGTTGPFMKAALSRELDMIRVNVEALVELCHRFGTRMAERGRGGILNIASTAGFQPGPNMAGYYATKAYVISFSEALSEELRGSGVSVTAYCPGPVATEFARTAGNAESVLFKMGAVAKPDAVARDAYAALMARKPLAIQGLLNWLTVQMLRISPRALVRRMVAWVNSTG
jgi:short-subunit dehydrogenase